MRCKKCGSFAINHHLHGRDGSRKDLCDVCFWREKSIKFQAALEKILNIDYRGNAHQSYFIAKDALKDA